MIENVKYRLNAGESLIFEVDKDKEISVILVPTEDISIKSQDKQKEDIKMNGRLTVTVHSTDIYTVDEEQQAIGISEQARELFGEKQCEKMQKDLVKFLEDLRGWYVNIRFTNKLPEDL